MKRGKLYATSDGLIFLVDKLANFQRDLSPNYAKILCQSLISSEEISCSSFYIPEQVRRWCKSRTRPQHEVILQQPYAQEVYQLDRINLDPYCGNVSQLQGLIYLQSLLTFQLVSWTKHMLAIYISLICKVFPRTIFLFPPSS